MKTKNFVISAVVVLLTGIFFGCPNDSEESLEFQNPPVPRPESRGVTVSPGLLAIGKGMSEKFTATVTGSGVKNLRWSVQGGTGGTAIDNAGLLTVDEHEAAKTITIKAVLSDDQGKYGTAIVRIIGNEDAPKSGGLTINPQTVMLGPGDTQVFNAYFSEDGTVAGSVKWEVTSADGSSFLSSSNALLIADGENAEKLTVTGRLEDGRYGSAIVTVLGNETDTVVVNNGIRVSPRTASAKTGKSITFVAYSGVDNSSITSGLSWDVFCGASGTKISTAGKLDVAADEGAARLTVRAKAQDGSYGTAVVEVTDGSSGSSGSAPVGMAQVPGGSFVRTDGYRITISGFLIGIYEVTQKEWRDVMGDSGQVTTSYGLGDDYPMYKVSWYDAVNYCNALSVLEGLEPAYTIGTGSQPAVTCDFTKNGYRLPTEAEWEYAARGGESYKYSGSDDRNVVGWFNGGKTHSVGQKMPNGYGLYDMSGNVWEWCWDIYHDYVESDQTDPTGPYSGQYRVNRGGAWDRGNDNDTVYTRWYDSPTFKRMSTVGFRVARRP